MKIIVLHGEDTDKSYGRFQKFVTEAHSRNWEILYDDLSLTPSLFGQERLVVIRDYKILGKKILGSLKKIDGTIVVYCDSIIPKYFFQVLPKDSKVEEFKLPKLIWKFLENLFPGNSEKSVQVFHNIIERDPVEFIFTLIARQFRDLYWVKTDSASITFESWKVKKLQIQAAKFDTKKLKEILSQLSEIDILVKTSKSDLVSSLDLLLLKQLE